jgi:hypothetical protein
MPRHSSLDLSSIGHERFEDLVEAVFRHDDRVVSINRSGRGADAGRDLLITTQVSDGVSVRQFKYLVQCKHRVSPRRAIGPGDFGCEFAFADRVAHHKADGYLLVCNTRPTTGLQDLFDSLSSQNGRRILYLIWDGARVVEEVTKHSQVTEQFFPDFYRYRQGLIEAGKIRDWLMCYGDAVSPEARQGLQELTGLPQVLTDDT